MGASLLLFAALLVIVVPTGARGDNADSNADVGCGGFVRVAGDLGGTKPDFSPIKVKLLTKGGAAKGESECAPNGYYYIPIYDAGTYVIKMQGPPGWIFSPEEIEVSRDSSGPCAQGKDLDFAIVGFALAGRVLTEGADTGPAGVHMELKGSSAKTYTTTTDAGGAFSFRDAPQGQYTLTASHPKWKFKTSSSEVSTSFGGSEIKETFGVLGYDVSGRVGWASGAPASSIKVLLKPKKAGKEHKTTTDDAGMYTFENVPPGDYVALVDGKGFEVEPAKGVAIQVAHGSLAVSELLTIKSFSVSGKILDCGGAGVAGASVLVDGKQAATTDASGSYTLKTTAGTYSITAAKEHMVFATLSNYEITAQLQRIGSISAEKYSLCGAVVLADGETASRSGLGVTLKPAKGGSAVQTTKTDQHGKFCFSVAVGDYTASVSGSAVAIHPKELAVSVVTGPILDVSFAQAALNVRGQCKCLDTPCTGISVALMQNGKTISTQASGSGVFAFDGVSPGSYTVKVSRSGGGGGWCWERAEATVRVGQEDTSSLRFVQTGIEKPVVWSGSSGTTSAVTLKHASGSSHELVSKAGQTVVCLPKRGAFEVEPPACHQLATSSFTDSTPDVLDLSPRKHGVIFKATALNGGSLDITFGVKQLKAGGSTSNERDFELIKATSKDRRVFLATYWGAPGDEIEVTPRSSDPSVIIEPVSGKVTVGSSEGGGGGGGACPAPALTFTTKIGKTVSGKVLPGIPGVTIIAEEEGGAEVIRTETGADGTYSIGPLDDKSYKVRAEKTNFQFVKDGNDFRSLEMGEVRIEAVDESGTLLAGVLLSMSGEGGFRQNTKTNDNGTYVFSGLRAGEYFLRPIVKEYQFAPSSQAITVKEGSNPAIKIKAKRVAFSAVGAVKLLDGNPEKNCLVVAVALDGSGQIEEGVSDPEGAFRIRGLKPTVQYAISVKTGDEKARHERGSPSSITITMGAKDYTEGLAFMAFRKQKQLTLVGTVEAEQALRSSITVEVMSASNAGVVLAALPLAAANYFEFSGLSRGDYLLRATSSLDSRAYKISSAPVTVSLQDGSAQVAIAFKAVPRNSPDTVTNTNFIFLVVLVAGAYVFANRREIMVATPPAISPAVASSYSGNFPPPQAKKAPKKAN